MPPRRAALSNRASAGVRPGIAGSLGGTRMHIQPDSPRSEASPTARRLHVVLVDEDSEILALWAAALNADSYDVAVTASEDELIGLPDRVPRAPRTTGGGGRRTAFRWDFSARDTDADPPAA